MENIRCSDNIPCFYNGQLQNKFCEKCKRKCFCVMMSGKTQNTLECKGVSFVEKIISEGGLTIQILKEKLKLKLDS